MIIGKLRALEDDRGNRIDDAVDRVIGYGSLTARSLPTNRAAVATPALVIRPAVAWERANPSLSKQFSKPDTKGPM